MDTTLNLNILGLVEAGFPTSASEEMLDTISLDEYLIENKESAYMLRVKSDSMSEAGILKGDWVIVDRGATPKDGDLVVALIDDAYVLKHFNKKKREEINVEAVVRSVIRKY